MEKMKQEIALDEVDIAVNLLIEFFELNNISAVTAFNASMNIMLLMLLHRGCSKDDIQPIVTAIGDLAINCGGELICKEIYHDQ